jgi:hypothetical protein
MAFNINEFRSEIGKGGIAKQSHFDLFVGIPRDINFSPVQTGSALGRALAFRCETAELPGVSLATIDHRVYGPARKIAYGNIYTDMTLSFLCSHDLKEKVFFDRWIEEISGSGQKSNTYDVKYLSQYKADQFIFQYDEKGNRQYAVQLIDAYPTLVSPLSLNRDSNELHKVSVTMTYHRWQRILWDDSIIPLPPATANRGSFVAGVSAVGGAVASFLPAAGQQAIGAVLTSI